MAVRPIDANELYRIEKLLDTDIVRQDKVALNLLEQVLYDIQHVPTLTPPNEWVSVEERLPTDEHPVLVFVGYADTMTGFITTSSYFCFDENPHWQWDGLVQDEQRTLYWMPLPAPPGKDNNVPAKAPNEPLTQEDIDKMHFDRVWIDYGLDDSGERCGEDGVILYGKLYSIDTLDGSAFEDLLLNSCDGETLGRPGGDYTVYRRPPEGGDADHA